jgi:hypothetical protein
VISNLVGVFAKGRRDFRNCFRILAGAAVLLLLALRPRVGSGEGDPPSLPGPQEPARLCGRRHPGSGETAPVDLGAVRKAYRDLEHRLGTALRLQATEAVAPLRRPPEAALPACRGAGVRTERLAEGKVARLRGRVLFFTEVQDPERLELPPEIAENPRAEILLLQVRSLGDLPRIAARLGRPVGLGSAELARALGVRCANTWLEVSEKGDELEFHESR